MTNHTTDTEAEASAAVEIQMMEEVSNSNNANTNTKRLGIIPSFSMFNFNGLIVFAVMTVTFIVIAVFVSLNAADRAMMMASQQEAIVSAKSTKAPKASKAPVCLWPQETTLCSEFPTIVNIIFDDSICPTEEAEGKDVGAYLILGSNGLIVMKEFVSDTQFIGEISFSILSVTLVAPGEVEIQVLSNTVGTFSAAKCVP